ncbi:hypothetical protein EBU71_19140 [bacterium]|nr:hypothetical protein [Candidatus Elulimicrobium humile]
MWFDGKIKTLGEVEVTNLKELLPLIDESYWLSDNRRSVNANFSETHTLWIREFVPTNDNDLHYFDRLSKYVSLTTEWAILNTEIENIVKGECVKSGIIRLKPGKKSTVI